MEGMLLRSKQISKTELFFAIQISPDPDHVVHSSRIKLRKRSRLDTLF
jgi:hypothetical protein